MQAAVTEYIVAMRPFPTKRRYRKKAESDHNNAPSSGLRMKKNRTNKKTPAAANRSSAYPGKETGGIARCACSAGVGIDSLERQSTATITNSTKSISPTGAMEEM